MGNPYVLGSDRILLGTVLLALDVDIFSRLTVALRTAAWPLKKRGATSLFADTMARLVDEADRSPHLSPRQKFHLTAQLRELERATRKKRGRTAEGSTTWHRTASRLETYVDLGILTKGGEDPRERFEYAYHPTPILSGLAESLQSESDPVEWLEVHLVACLLGRQTRQEPLGLDEMREPLMRLVTTIRSPTTSYPIHALATGLATLLADTERPISLRCGRASLEELARSHPELARLARGTSGQRAEYVTLDVRKI